MTTKRAAVTRSAVAPGFSACAGSRSSRSKTVSSRRAAVSSPPSAASSCAARIETRRATSKSRLRAMRVSGTWARISRKQRSTASLTSGPMAGPPASATARVPAGRPSPAVHARRRAGTPMVNVTSKSVTYSRAILSRAAASSMASRRVTAGAGSFTSARSTRPIPPGDAIRMAS